MRAVADLKQEIADLKEKLGMLQIHSDHTETLLKSCETALEGRNSQLANSIPKERVEALISAYGLSYSDCLEFISNQPINQEKDS